MTRSDETLKAERLDFYQADLDRIERCMDEFLSLSGARCALLVDRDGHLVTRKGELDGFQLDTISALVAGTFAATRQMAKLLGEGQFNSLYHQGEKENLLIHLAGERSLLTVVFDAKTTLGMVRLYTAEAAKRLQGLFEEAQAAAAESKPQAPFGSEFDPKSNLNQILGE